MPLITSTDDEPLRDGQVYEDLIPLGRVAVYPCAIGRTTRGRFTLPFRLDSDAEFWPCPSYRGTSQSRIESGAFSTTIRFNQADANRLAAQLKGIRGGYFHLFFEVRNERPTGNLLIGVTPDEWRRWFEARNPSLFPKKQRKDNPFSHLTRKTPNQ